MYICQLDPRGRRGAALEARRRGPEVGQGAVSGGVLIVVIVVIVAIILTTIL